jgi:hypothetical protein
MQPRFPADHHFHRRNRNPQGAPGVVASSTNQSLAPADYLMRQCLPAFDASDPRGPA